MQEVPGRDQGILQARHIVRGKIILWNDQPSDLQLCNVWCHGALKPDTWAAGFSWTEELEEGFKLAKQKIIEAVTDGVRHFEMDIGFFLMQKWCECEKLHPSCCTDGWKLVLAGGRLGRFTKPAESRYSLIEGELLAVTDALYKARHFILGCTKLMVAVDHKP